MLGGSAPCALADSGRFPMAWLSRPCFRGDLFLCTVVLPSWYFRAVYEADVNLQCGASALRGRNAVCRCSLPCVGMANERPGRICSRPEREALCSLKPWLQKRLKKRMDCGGNHLGCSIETEKGLQCGLSGNRVACSGNDTPLRRRGNRLHRQRGVRRGENQPVPKP